MNLPERITRKIEIPASGCWIWTEKTHCKHGHAFDDENTIVGNGGRWRQCRRCANERRRVGC